MSKDNKLPYKFKKVVKSESLVDGIRKLIDNTSMKVSKQNIGRARSYKHFPSPPLQQKQ